MVGIGGNKIMLILKPSPIHGVGVFTTENIKRGAILPSFFDNRTFTTELSQGWEQRFSVVTNDWGGGYYLPNDFNKISITWYLNHSDKPNISRIGQALRLIEAGKELTINYKTLKIYTKKGGGIC